MMGISKENKGKKAYTLIEVLLVIALISIITSIFIPNTRMFQNIKAKNEIKEFRKDLLFARNAAILENSYYYIYFEIDKNRYFIKKATTESPIKTKDFDHGISLDNRSNITVLQFNPNGRPGNSGSIYLTDLNNKAYKITVTPATGRIDCEYQDE